MESSALEVIEENDAAAGTICYFCQAPLTGDARTCLVCGHRQYRVCYCGEQIRPDVATCPHCQTDWSQSSRVKAKRKSRSHGSVHGLLRSAVTGAIVFGGLCGFLYLAGGRAAQGLGEEAPADVAVRLAYLVRAIVFGATLLAQRLGRLGSSAHLLQLAGLMVMGAGLGVLCYLLRHNRWIRIKLGLLKSRRHRRAA
jgi:hypothetical protein